MFARCISPTQKGICWCLSLTMRAWNRGNAGLHSPHTNVIESDELIYSPIQTPLPSPPRGRSYVLIKPIMDLKNHHPLSQEKKPTPCPLPWERGKPIRRSIVTIGVRSVTMQAWGKGNAGMHSKSAVASSACFAAPIIWIYFSNCFFNFTTTLSGYFNSCSHTRTTFHPAFLNSCETYLSRPLFCCNFFAQNS